MEKTCNTCTHWSQVDIIGPCHRCARIKTMKLFAIRVEPFMLDPSWMYTPETFGCTEWKGR